MYQFRTTFILTFAMCTFGHRGYSQAPFPDAIYINLEQGQQQARQFTEALRNIDEKSVAAAEERAVILFSRGLAELDTNPAKAAESFESARKLLPVDSAVQLLSQIYAGRSAMSPQTARSVLTKLKVAVSGRNRKSSLWKPEQFALMLEVMMALKQDAQVAKVFGEMETRVKPAQRPDDVVRKLPKYIDQRPANALKQLIPVVESLAAEYPHSETGRWGFQKVQDIQCRQKSGYVIAQSLIARLASNTNLDEGLKHYLIELTKGPMRLSSGRIVRLDETERVSFLTQLRFWNEARRILEEDVASLEGVTSQPGKVKLARAMMALGTVQSKQNDHEMAARTWARYLELFSDVADGRVAYEGLADSLSKLKVFPLAARMYEVLAKSPSSDPVLRWHHFWNLYLGGEYQNALALLDRGGYVPHRDRGIDGGLDYWRARVLEKLGRDKEADEILRRIVTESGSSYYAMMIQARRPKLVESTAAGIFGTSDQLKEATGLKSPTNSNANENPDVSEESSEAASPGDYKITVAMRKWGLFQYGRRLHRTLPIKPQPTANGGLESFKLAFDLQDYSYGLKSLSLPGSPLKKIPTSRTQIEQHISKYNSDWRTLYPFAFKDIVESMAKAADVDPFLIVSLMRAESVYDQDARSLVGARGLMQIMPFTGVRIARTMGDGVFAVSDLHSPEVNIGYGAYYIKKLINYYRGSEILAVAAYNGGPGAVDRWLGVYQNLEMDEFVESIPFRETRRYVKSVFRNFDNYKRIWQQSKALSALPELPRSTTGGEIF